MMVVSGPRLSGTGCFVSDFCVDAGSVVFGFFEQGRGFDVGGVCGVAPYVVEGVKEAVETDVPVFVGVEVGLYCDFADVVDF